MPTTRRNTIFYPALAKQYIHTIKTIRSLLRIKRDEYKLAESARDEVEMNKMKAEFDEIWQTKWPHYNGVDHVPSSPSASPYPPDGVISKISARARWQIIATALLARRGVDKRRRFEGLVPKINGAADVNEFKWAIKEYINAPSYPRGSSEEDEEDPEWEEYADADTRQITPPANPFPGQQPTYRRQRERPYADMPPEGSPGLVTQGTVAQPAPAYSSPPNYYLIGQRSDDQLVGGKTRKHKRSKHQRSKHKRSKHKRSKHKRSKHKRSKTYKK